MYHHSGCTTVKQGERWPSEGCLHAQIHNDELCFCHKTEREFVYALLHLSIAVRDSQLPVWNVRQLNSFTHISMPFTSVTSGNLQQSVLTYKKPWVQLWWQVSQLWKGLRPQYTPCSSSWSITNRPVSSALTAAWEEPREEMVQEQEAFAPWGQRAVCFWRRKAPERGTRRRSCCALEPRLCAPRCSGGERTVWRGGETHIHAHTEAHSGSVQ